MEMSSADRCVIIAVHNCNGKYNPYPAASVDHDCVFLIKVSIYLRTHPSMLAPFIEFRQVEEHVGRNLPVHDAKHDGWSGCEEEVEENHEPVVNHGCAREAAKELVPEQEVNISLGR